MAHKPSKVVVAVVLVVCAAIAFLPPEGLYVAALGPVAVLLEIFGMPIGLTAKCLAFALLVLFAFVLDNISSKKAAT